jgi:hypothetical protein
VQDKTKLNRPYLSAHVLGAAIDFDAKDMTAEEVRSWIYLNKSGLPYPIRLEQDVSWVHLDVVFLFPFELATGFQESVMQRNNIGGAWIRLSKGSLVFTLRGTQILEIDAAGVPMREVRNVQTVRKFGNQGNSIRGNDK